MKWKMILVGITAIAGIMAINTDGIAFADPQHCDRTGWPSCYGVGFDNGKANPGASCPSGHSKNSIACSNMVKVSNGLKNIVCTYP